MTREEAKAFIAAIVALREAATDEQALNAVNVYPSWKSGINYVTGYRVLYNDVLYKVVQSHTSQSDWAPDVASGLFAKVLVSDDGTILQWEQPDSTNPYMAGDKVIYDGKIWESVVNNNVWTPSTYGWIEVE